MHKSTILRMNWFVENYVLEEGKKILDVGSMDQDFSYRKLFDGKQAQYIGLDIAAGPNVDVIMDKPYEWDSLEDESFDFVISGQAFEHMEYPWLTIKEIYKKMKPGGLCCIIAPNTSGEHKMPLDCYRFFSDGLAALAKWAGFLIIDVTVSGIPCREASPEWDSFDNDVCLIAKKPKKENQIEEIKTLYPKFKLERRIHGLLDQKLRYKCLVKWSDMEDKQEFFNNFFRGKDIKKVYIYGYGSIGKLLYKELKKIFLILCPPYYAFEILANCVDDIKDNKKYYPGMKSEEIEKINSISKKLDNICICLNSAAYELDKLLSNFDKYSSFEYNN